MATLDRYVPNRAGILAILSSPGVTAELMGRGERVKAAAEANNQMMEVHRRRSKRTRFKSRGVERGVKLEFYVVSAPTRVRSRVRVVADHPGALNAERRHGILANALNAAG